MAVLPRQVPLALRIGITVLLLGLYYFGPRVKLPLLHPERLALGTTAATATRLSVVGLGIAPLITGFLLAELWALATSTGRRLRTGGWAGRQRLNRIALGVSLALSLTQGFGIALFLERAPLGAAGYLVDEPGWGFRLIVTCTLTAATAAIYLLGNLITAWGVGNGFCLVWLVTGLRPLLNHPERLRAVDDRIYIDLAVLAVVSALFLRRVRVIQVTSLAEPLALPLPAAPQSIVPLNLAYALPSLAPLAVSFGIDSSHWPASNLLAVAVVPLASLLFFSWLGSRRRMLENLPAGTTLEPGADAAIHRQLLLAIAFLAGVPLLSSAMETYAGMPLGIVTFSFFLFAVATALDVYDHVRYLSAQDAVPLLELDNVHLAAYLKRRLAAAGIPALVQGYQARSLFLLFGPLYKMDLLVPAERQDEARTLVAEELEEALRTF